MDDWSCPSCGDDLYDLSKDIPVDQSMFEALDRLLRYYCENCNEFYGKDSIKEEIFAR